MRPRHAAFTLIELMTALAIFGVVAVTLYGTFSRTLRSKALAEQRAEVVRLGRAAVNRMADEIGSAYYPTAVPEAPIFRVLKTGTEEVPLDSVEFTALSSRPAGIDGRGTDQRMIVYFFPRDRSSLRRSSRAMNGGDGASAAASTASGRQRDLFADDADDFFAAFGAAHPPIAGVTARRLLRREATLIERQALDDVRATAFRDDVASLELRCFDGHEWRDEWDSQDASSRGLPRAVAIDLALYDQAGAIHYFPTAVDLPLREPTAGSGTGGPSTSPTPKPKPTTKSETQS